MAILSFNIPDDEVTELLDDFTTGLPITVGEDGEPIMTPVAWAKQDIRKHVLSICAKGRAIKLRSLAEDVPYSIT